MKGKDPDDDKKKEDDNKKDDDKKEGEDDLDKYKVEKIHVIGKLINVRGFK